MVLFFIWTLLLLDDAPKTQFTGLIQELEAQIEPGQSYGQTLVTIAETQLGKPYLERTLEVEGPEQLVVRLDGFDCFTLVESVLTFAICIGTNQPDWDSFQEVLQRIRYRNGQLIDYTSRLHYTTDWAFDNQSKGFLEDVTQAIGGEPYSKTIDFMTQHRDAYRQLADDQLFAKMGPIEAALNQRRHFYIPKAKIASVEKSIMAGDILAITTRVKGLDIAHVGFATFKDGRLHMLHASSTQKRVEITKEPFADYLANHTSQTGIMIFRPRAP